MCASGSTKARLSLIEKDKIRERVCKRERERSVSQGILLLGV